jgi:hypothetical protein
MVGFKTLSPSLPHTDAHAEAEAPFPHPHRLPAHPAGHRTGLAKAIAEMTAALRVLMQQEQARAARIPHADPVAKATSVLDTLKCIRDGDTQFLPPEGAGEPVLTEALAAEFAQVAEEEWRAGMARFLTPILRSIRGLDGSRPTSDVGASWSTARTTPA